AVGEDFGDRGQAVGGARGVGNDAHVALEHAFVHAHDDGGVHVVTAGGGDQHAAGALVEQDLGLGLGGVGAGAFEQHVHAVAAPVHAQGVLGGVEGDLLAVDDDDVLAFGLDRGGEAAVGGVVPEQVGVGGQIAGGVDGDHFKLVLQALLVDGAQRAATDTTETVDGDLDAHRCFSLKL